MFPPQVHVGRSPFLIYNCKPLLIKPIFLFIKKVGFTLIKHYECHYYLIYN
ncbi:hypothetical protein [Spiroplasma endosymbiont of Virgichneumon dumeticola]|uniref:hypothetical protein n=1 Tax=Spiroplasma endosymbiont of Virgichneumon dumeticola TaxID=3139323 RepID=UPI0035C88B74